MARIASTWSQTLTHPVYIALTVQLFVTHKTKLPEGQWCMDSSQYPGHPLLERLIPSDDLVASSSRMTTTFNSGKEERADLAEQSRIPTLWGSLVDAGTWQQVGSAQWQRTGACAGAGARRWGAHWSRPQC